MVAAIGTFNGHAAFSAVLPAVCFGGLDEGCGLGIVGTFLQGRMVFAVAFGAHFSVAFWAFAVDPFALLVNFDVFWLDPCTAALVGAIEAVFGGPLRILGVPKLPKFALV